LVLPHKENRLHPIHRTIKSQDNFTERSQHERLFPVFVLHYKQKQLTLQSNKQRDY
jgi:inorganic diphosphatase